MKERNTMSIKHLILTSLASSGLLLASATGASAATCSNPSISVATNVVSVEEGHPINYSYSFCYNSQSDHYTVQVVKENPSPTGTFTTEEAMPAQNTALTGASGTTDGEGSYTPTSSGRYKVIVAYYEKSQATWESEGETVFLVTATPPKESPKETPKEEPAVTPEIPKTPEVVKAPEAPKTPVVIENPPVAPIGHVATPKAKIALVKRAVRSVVKTGQVATFTLTVSNVSHIIAQHVEVCDALPAQTQYVGASRSATFRGASACFTIGNLSAGAKVKITIRLSINVGTHAAVVNHATATATNAPSVHAQAKVRVPGAPRRLVAAPVTG